MGMIAENTEVSQGGIMFPKDNKTSAQIIWLRGHPFTVVIILKITTGLDIFISFLKYIEEGKGAGP